MTSFIAILGAAGLAIGIAWEERFRTLPEGSWSWCLSHFKVDDLIDTQGHIGVVKEIQNFVTILLTPENKTVILPNGAVANGEITNYTTEGNIRVDLEFGILYNDSIDNAKKILYKVMEEHPLVLDDPKAFVWVVALGDSSVNLVVRPYSKPRDYWKVSFDVYEQGKKALDAGGIEIPFPQMVVHQASSWFLKINSCVCFWWWAYCFIPNIVSLK